MDKPSHLSCDSSVTNTSSRNQTSRSSTEQYLTHLNRISHKISKSVRKHSPDQSRNQNQSLQYLHRRSPPPPPLPSLPQPPNLQQPPVYNINKNEFRDLVQKLTGSPAHERFSTPSPIHAPKPQSSRLQRIRPPPLSGVTNRPPQIGAFAPPWHPASVAAASVRVHSPRSAAAPPPFSPLPPFPSVNGAAESPISAYMRYLQSSISNVDADSKQISRSFSLISPRNSASSIQQHMQIQNQSSATISASLPLSQFIMPSSPLSFGCLSSPRSSHPLVSPRLLISPTSSQLGFPQLPLSPILPFSSPRWRGL